jgi:hypothetical protein
MMSKLATDLFGVALDNAVIVSLGVTGHVFGAHCD